MSVLLLKKLLKKMKEETLPNSFCEILMQQPETKHDKKLPTNIFHLQKHKNP